MNHISNCRLKPVHQVNSVSYCILLHWDIDQKFYDPKINANRVISDQNDCREAVYSSTVSHFWFQTAVSFSRYFYFISPFLSLVVNLCIFSACAGDALFLFANWNMRKKKGNRFKYLSIVFYVWVWVELLTKTTWKDIVDTCCFTHKCCSQIYQA